MVKDYCLLIHMLFCFVNFDCYFDGQKEGIPMGSPTSGIMSEIFLQTWRMNVTAGTTVENKGKLIVLEIVWNFCFSACVIFIQLSITYCHSLFYHTFYNINKYIIFILFSFCSTAPYTKTLSLYTSK